MNESNPNHASNSSVLKINNNIVKVANYIDWIINKHGACNSTWSTMAAKVGCTEYEVACAVTTMIDLGKYRVILQDIFGTGKQLHVIYKA